MVFGWVSCVVVAVVVFDDRHGACFRSIRLRYFGLYAVVMKILPTWWGPQWRGISQPGTGRSYAALRARTTERGTHRQYRGWRTELISRRSQPHGTLIWKSWKIFLSGKHDRLFHPSYRRIAPIAVVMISGFDDASLITVMLRSIIVLYLLTPILNSILIFIVSIRRIIIADQQISFVAVQPKKGDWVVYREN